MVFCFRPPSSHSVSSKHYKCQGNVRSRHGKMQLGCFTEHLHMMPIVVLMLSAVHICAYIYAYVYLYFFVLTESAECALALLCVLCTDIVRPFSAKRVAERASPGKSPPSAKISFEDARCEWCCAFFRSMSCAAASMDS